MKKIQVPVVGPCDLNAGDFVELTGKIFCGRDAVLPKIVQMKEEGTLEENGVFMEGAVIFHTAVSCAGIAPTTTSKPEIEGSIAPLSEAGAKMHIGKGRISQKTIDALKENGSYFLITPPVSALLTSQMSSKKAIIHPEYGMEAFYEIEVENFPAIVAVAKGKTIFSDSEG